MNIKKEDFNKLKQLDRIEFRQTKDIIDRKFDVNFTQELMFVSIYLIASFSIVRMRLLVSIMFPEIHSSFAISTNILMALLTLCVIIKLFYNPIKSIIRSALTSKLEQEYFTEEVKVKK